MKINIASIIVLVLIMASCSKHVYVNKPLPPGQAKKMTGSQSAKQYAPGQVKKR